MFDVIIIGGGHAGVEAANISSKKKLKTLLITSNIENIGALSCNPSIGGIGKGHLVKEINSLGGIMGELADKSGIQFKIINYSKGEAVRSIRIQLDKNKYKIYTNKKLKKYKNLKIIEETVIKLIINKNNIKGVKTNIKNTYFSKTIIITTGTFLNGKIYIGSKIYLGGRLNENNSNYLANQLKELNNYGGRLKTGTPPRLCIKNIDFKNLKLQKGDKNPVPLFSKKSLNYNQKNQIKCWITETNEKTHEIIKKSIKYSPIYNNLINGVGPRYCPSIEEKIYRFYNKKSHQIFLEPEKKKSILIYPNGISTSLPYNIQKKLIKTIKGLEKTEIIKPGYAIEYDFFNPSGLKKSLELKSINGIFFAGQINGSTGYEEAAAQGLIAGINAYLFIKNKKQWEPNNKNSYLGVLINDLTKKGVIEPYRIFTSRAENRLKLREDNVNYRLIKIIKNLKLIKTKNFNKIKYKKRLINLEYFLIYKKKLKNFLLNLIKEESIIIKNLIKLKIKIFKKYTKYLNLKKKENKKLKTNKNLKIPSNINFFHIKGLSNECSEILNKNKPKNMKDIKNLQIINNNSIILILNFLKKLKNLNNINIKQ